MLANKGVGADMAVEMCSMAVLWEGDLHVVVYHLPFPGQRPPLCFPPGGGCPWIGGSMEKEAWQRRVKISVFLPFAVTRIRFPPLQQHDVLAVGVMEE